VTTEAESERERNKRHYQRALFDGIADTSVTMARFSVITASPGPADVDRTCR
jgi:hypothetical protein